MALSISLSPALRPTRSSNAVSCSDVKQELVITLLKVVLFAKKDQRSSDGFSWKKKFPKKKYSPLRDDLVSNSLQIQGLINGEPHLGRYFRTLP